MSELLKTRNNVDILAAVITVLLLEGILLKNSLSAFWKITIDKHKKLSCDAGNQFEFLYVFNRCIQTFSSRLSYKYIFSMT